jgi:hypothetical protein
MEPFGVAVSAIVVCHLGFNIAWKFRQLLAEKRDSRPAEELDMVADEVENLTKILHQLNDIVDGLPTRTDEDEALLRDAAEVCQMILEPLESMQQTLEAHIHDHPHSARRLRGMLAVLSWTFVKPKLIWYRHAINTNYDVLKTMLGAFQRRGARTRHRQATAEDSYPEMKMYINPPLDLLNRDSNMTKAKQRRASEVSQESRVSLSRELP